MTFYAVVGLVDSDNVKNIPDFSLITTNEEKAEEWQTDGYSIIVELNEENVAEELNEHKSLVSAERLGVMEELKKASEKGFFDKDE